MRIKDSLKFPASLFLILVYLLSSLAIEPNPKRKAGDRKSKPSKIRQTIVLSIDGFPAYYWSDPKYHSYFPHLAEIFREYGAREIATVNPSVTYPAHTSMVTGLDPAEHGIYNNTLADPFEKNDGGWMWYAEDIKVPTLWDLAKANRKTTANVFWPVTVGASIDWNLPQYWRKKIPEDDKLLRVLSTKDLHREAELAVGSPLNDLAKDEIKLKTATWLFSKKKPDLMFVYTTDLDTNHHGFGPGSEKALQRLVEIDKSIYEFLQSVGAFSPKGPAVVIVSDHGFHSADSVCAPNVILKQKGYINDEAGTYQLTFKSSGGTALLLASPNTVIPVQDLQKITSEIVEVCPGTEWVLATPATSSQPTQTGQAVTIPNDNNSIQSKIHPTALGVLRTTEKLFISGTRKGEVFTKSQTPIHGHGYWNANPEMKTIGFVYDPRGKMHSFQSVKDVFGIVKDLSGIKEKKTKGPRVSTKP
ncbi:type I phosphodiesterase/nucleotide pyrophosphatase [Leptospira wolbachii serovar Codice str. CDC]|uniref:Type I phosphodiesterase/nucleotide pyrophosphatase n=1 Tax=Leptospira wolbachii serovar Codice str. CDC TaxID=1218599 RepID=R8ZZT6_9LEPT|nr:ectonucleotide pyrophosphatase/phosphodiesterase [Leptospira wolbachii]EOQ95362.1 type I phosphodiesterase/nucleotide pyrophosphatase [Leptospira wolbachii serovar Codice str. CDC]